MNFNEVLEPLKHNVEISDTANRMKSILEQHISMPEGASTAVVLWCIATFDIDIFDIFPKVVVYSPEKRCGKSTLLDLIESFSHRSMPNSNITAAAIFRLIDAYQPTLILDEADTFVANSSSDMTGIINSGHAKKRAFIVRCGGDDNEPKMFSTWAPMAFGSIDRLQGTIMDRSIAIELRRKASYESLSKLTSRVIDDNKVFRQEVFTWYNENKEKIAENMVEPISLGNDRAVDNWIPLFSIAKQISKEWFEMCESAYLALNQFEDEPDESTLLLIDIQAAFNKVFFDKMSSSELVEALIENKDRLWCEYNRGRALTQNGLAQLLKVYGIRPKGLRIGDKTMRGYEVAQFKDTFERYLS